MALIGASSQVKILLDAVGQAGVRHGSRVVADLEMVRVDGTQYGDGGDVYFCNLPEIEVVKVIAKGDSLALSQIVRMPDIVFSHDGFFNLRNVLVTANGRLVISRIPETDIQMVLEASLSPLSWPWYTHEMRMALDVGRR